MKEAGVQFHERVPTIFYLQKWFPKGGLLVLDDLMAKGGSRFKVNLFHTIYIKLTYKEKYCYNR